MLDLVEECVSGSPWDREDSVGADDADAVEALGHEQILTALALRPGTIYGWSR